jgi:hypothetical protein
MALSPGFLAVAAKLQEAATAMSQSDIRTRITSALTDAFKTGSGYGYSYSYAYVVDIFGDDTGGDVVYSYNDDLKKAPYTITGASCKIDTTKAVAVAPLTTYEVQGDTAVTEAGARNSKRDLAQIQAIHDNASKLGANCKMAEAAAPPASGSLKLIESTAWREDTIELLEAAGGSVEMEIKLIAPGKGSSAFYPAEVLKRDGPKCFLKNTQIYINHATRAEEAARPEGDWHKLAGALNSDAYWKESAKHGAGLYATALFTSEHAPLIREKSAYSGMSIRANGSAVMEAGQPKLQDGVPILAALTSAESVDVVTRAGAGGLILNEAQRIAAPAAQEQGMTEQEKTQLSEATANNAWLRKRVIRGDAEKLAGTILKDCTLAEAAKLRVIETCLNSVPEKDGELDRVVFTEAVTAEAKREGAYVASFGASGQVRGMGAAPGAVELTEAQRAEADLKNKRENDEAVKVFESFGMSKEAAAAAAKGRAA